MNKRYFRNKRFLKNFVIITFFLLTLIVWIISVMYNMSIRALEQDVKTINMNNVYEYENNVEEILQQCNIMASSLSVDNEIQFFFSIPYPEQIFDNYYEEVSNKLFTYGISYIDSIILYSPNYEMVFTEDFRQSMTVAEIVNSSQNNDLSWLAYIQDVERTTTDLYIRSKFESWPYLLSLVKHYRSGNIDGVVIINIDLQKLYNYLLPDKNVMTQFYMIDKTEQIFLKKQKYELYTPMDDIPELTFYNAKESFCIINSDGGYAYAQVYSEKYQYTFVTITQIGDILAKMNEVSKRFLVWSVCSFVLAIAVACIYSVSLTKPILSIQRMLEEPEDWNRENVRFDDDIIEIADKIMFQLQSNTKLREELDGRLNSLHNTQMIALQAQINPHFMFNTLNMLSVMVEADCGDGYLGVQIIGDLADILRYALSGCSNVTIGEEFEYVKKFLFIARYRYEVFEFSIDMNEELYDCTIPKLVLQPLVENALQHGILPCLPKRNGNIALSVQEILYTYSSGRTLLSVCVDIIDNGIGMDEQQLDELRKSINNDEILTEHIGVSNVAKRFFLLFRDEQEFIIESTLGKGTQIHVIFPKIVSKEK